MRMTNNSINTLLNENRNLNTINFGLFFKKFIELDENNSFKKFNNYEENLLKVYNNIDENIINKFLKEKNENLTHYLENLSNNYNFYTFEKVFRLKNKMIVGIGESTAIEVGMIFEHNIGIPYIPASSIKGIVRYSYLMHLLQKIENDPEIKDHVIEKDVKENKEYLIENAEHTNIFLLFGGDKLVKKSNYNFNYWELEDIYKGSIIFFDVFPSKKPKLETDIINVHYPDYYQNGDLPPTDSMNPKLIKFLTVSNNTEFIFRFAINRNKINNELINIFIEVFNKALLEIGIGAKTNLGYGIFEIEEN